MPAVNQALLQSVRQTSRKSLEDIGANTQKTGKEKVREGTQKSVDKSVARRAQQNAKFVSEQGKGSGISSIA